MPKYLDRPSWYESGGTQVYGVGVTNSASTYGDGAIPVYRAAAGGFTTISPTINGLHFTDINAWYAPVSKPSSSFALCYWTPNNRPEWLNMGTNGTLLKSSGSNPSWSGLYFHQLQITKPSFDAASSSSFLDMNLFVSYISFSSTPITSMSQYPYSIPLSDSAHINQIMPASGWMMKGSYPAIIVGWNPGNYKSVYYTCQQSGSSTTPWDEPARLQFYGSTETKEPTVLDRVVQIA